MSSQPLIAMNRVFIEGIYFSADEMQYQMDNEDIELSSETIKRIRQLGRAIFSGPNKCAFNNQFTLVLSPLGKTISPCCCFFESLEFLATAEVFNGELQGKGTVFNDSSISAIATGCFKKFPKEKVMHQKIKVVFEIRNNPQSDD